MIRPPRSSRAALLPARTLAWHAAQGAVVLALVLGLYLGGHAFGMPDAELRALTYFSLVTGIMALILVNRSFGVSIFEAVRRPNRVLALIFVLILSILGTSLLWPVATDLFGFGPLHAPDLVIVAATGIITLVLLERGKRLWSRVHAPMEPAPRHERKSPASGGARQKAG